MKLPESVKGERLDRAIQKTLAESGRAVSVSEVRDAIKAGAIRVNKRKRSPGDRAGGGEDVDLGAFVARAEARVPPDPELLARAPVLYEDAHLLALSKPSGVPTAPLEHAEQGTLLGAALAKAPEIEDAGPPLEGGLLHRLDTGTSGVVLFAKDQETRAKLRKAFGEGGIEKRYLALVLDADQAIEAGMVIDDPIGRGSKPSEVRIARPDDPEALEALTFVTEVTRLAKGCAWLEVRPRTGRRHQIRVHLSSRGAPILGDPIYGDTAALSAELGLGEGRLALHAATLVLPGGREIEAPLPSDLAAAKRNLEKP